MRKTFTARTCCCVPNKKKAFTAVKGTCLHIDSGSLFCLLGHNGAGKVAKDSFVSHFFLDYHLQHAHWTFPTISG
jgi:ABC-type uncharacterized transport system ATPase subunit